MNDGSNKRAETKAINGIGPGGGRGAYAEAVDRTIKLAKEDKARDMAKLRAAERYMVKHGWEWDGGKWV